MNERRRKRALITRPQEDSADAAIALARRGITPVLAPMMRIEYATADIENEVTLAQAILFTSRNAVRAFSRLSPRRDVAIFAVGDSTAALARDNGFVNVESAQGDSADLARLTIDRLDPADGLLFHAAGATVAGDLTDALNKAGFKTVRRPLYEAKALGALADETATALRDRTLDYVLFFSPRTGRIFADLVEKAGLTRTCDSLTAICLSDAVASEIAGIKWRNIVTAQLPTTAALLSVIAKLEDTGAPPAAETLPASGPDSSPESDISKPPTLVEQSVSADEDAEKPQESAMTEADQPPEPAKEPSKQPSEKASAPTSGQTSVPASKKSPEITDTPADKPADTKKESESSEMRNSAAALSAALAAAPTTTETAGRSRMGTVLVTLIAVIVVLGAGYATLPSWRDNLPPVVRDHLSGTAAVSDALQRENRDLGTRVTEMASKLQAKESDLGAAQSQMAAMENQAAGLTAKLTGKLAASEQALAALRTANTAGEAAAAENAALKGRIAALDQLLAAEKEARASADAATNKAEAMATERTATAGKLSATVDEAAGKIAGLEKNLDTARKAAVLAGKTDTIALAARKLRDALFGAAPFVAEIRVLKDMAGEAPAVAAALSAIEPLAPTGVATRNDLFARLPAAVTAVVAADRRPNNESWIDRTVSKLTGFVTVRRIDGKGAGADAILARAEMAARRGDLTATAKEISTLTDPGAAAAAPWLKAAQDRLAADLARAALDKIMLTGVGAGDPS
jgi:uroporphyrinogen-III synthase